MSVSRAWRFSWSGFECHLCPVSPVSKGYCMPASVDSLRERSLVYSRQLHYPLSLRERVGVRVKID